MGLSLERSIAGSCVSCPRAIFRVPQEEKPQRAELVIEKEVSKREGIDRKVDDELAPRQEDEEE